MIYDLNLLFANIVSGCCTLQESGILQPKSTRLYQTFAHELQVEINQHLMSTPENVELRDFRQFGKVRQAWEKDIHDPDDVFLHAEERRKELARRRQTCSSKDEKKAIPRPKTHVPRQKININLFRFSQS